ncbi:hypothetical protein N8578_01880, partial [Akkermansiaceae bacterium]|nr:hypothetical protein [Akkermansiaceae bacterium]
LAHFRPDAHILITCINDRKEAEKKGRSRKIFEVQSKVDGEEIADEGAEVIAKTHSDEEADEEAVIEILEGEGPDWVFVEAIVADLKRRLDSMGGSILTLSKNSMNLRNAITLPGTSMTTW